MPKTRKVAQLKHLNFPLPQEKTVSAFIVRDLPLRLKASPTKGSFIPFAIRAMVDYRNNQRLTPLQEIFVQVLKNSNTDTKLLRQYARFPQTLQKAFDQRFFTGSPTEADDLLRKTYFSARKEVNKGLIGAFNTKQSYKLVTAFRPVYVPYSSLAHIAEIGEPPPPPPVHTYNFEFSYRGIQTLKTGDRSGGVEPYLIANFNRVTPSGDLEKLVEPFVIKQSPSNLGDMGDDEWMPSGGEQDQFGNPSNPICIFNGNFPPLDLTLSYYAIIKVMEEDGGQGSQIANAMGEALIGIGGLIAGSTAPSGIGPIIGGIVAGLGFVSEFIGAIFSSSEGDDFIGDVVHWINSYDICLNGFREYPEYVKNGGNEWLPFMGLRSTVIN